MTRESVGLKRGEHRALGCDAAVFVAVCAVITYSAGAQAASLGLNPPPGNLILVVGPEATPSAAGPVSVTFTLTAPQIGTGQIDGSPVVQIEMVGRRPPSGPNFTAELRANAPAFVTSGGNQIPISDFSWTSVALAGASYPQVIPSGVFAAGGGIQLIDTLSVVGGPTRTTGGALTFHYANSAIYPAGSYGPTAITYTAVWVP
ncbi:MAG: hypothetical protein AMS22_08935 [Thiotrichales bacterium SG8_50]|jgi:hypothetical protein|nr:MAG: hypothetical protein AMS22_08935 [Thiotrichales bacterium SG8_50]KPL27171.1 MAG: hypothetical protein AMJ72_10455 [Acidithiobacillales bacterium SM1_46]